MKIHIFRMLFIANDDLRIIYCRVVRKNRVDICWYRYVREACESWCGMDD